MKQNGKETFRIKNLPPEFQSYIYKRSIAADAILIGLSIACIVSKDYRSIIVCALATFFYIAHLLYQGYGCFKGHIVSIDLYVTDVVRKEGKQMGKVFVSSKTCQVMLSDVNNNLYVQQAAYASAYKKGDIVRIYLRNGSISQINQNTYTILNPVFMRIMLSASVLPNQ